MDPVDLSEYDGVKVREVVQVTQIIIIGEGPKGEEVQIPIASNRRPIPTPYTEEP